MRGNFDYSSFESWAKGFSSKLRQSKPEDMLISWLEDLGDMVVGAVKEKTPVGDYSDKLVEFTTKDGKAVSFMASQGGRVGGNLRRNWELKSVTRKGSGFEIVIENLTEYAMAVEDGHKTSNGGWVEGQYMLRLTMEEFEPIIKSYVSTKYFEYMSDLLGGK